MTNKTKYSSLFLFTAARFEFWFVGYQRFVCTELGVTTGILKQTHHKSELSKVVGTEFVEALFQHSEKIQSLHLTVEDIAVLRSFLVVSPGNHLLVVNLYMSLLIGIRELYHC